MSIKKILTTFLALIMIFSLFSCSAKQSSDASETGTGTDTDSSSEITGDTVVLKGSTYSFTYAEVQFSVNYTVSTLLNSYASSYISEGLDLDTSFSDQIYDSDSGKTWADYFIQRSYEEMTRRILYCDAAEAAGMSLSSDEATSVESVISDWGVSATSDETYDSLDSYLSANFGTYVDTETLRSYLRKWYLASDYYNSYISEVDSESDDAIQAQYDSDPLSYEYVNCYSFRFSASDDTGITADEAKEYASELAATTSAEDFATFCEDYTINTLHNGDTSEVTKEEVDEGIKTYYLRWSDGDAGNYLFSTEREKYDTYTLSNDDDGVYSVIMLIDTARTMDYDLVNFIDIYLTDDTYGSESATQTFAQSIIDKMDGSDDESNMKSYAYSYSEDSAYASKYGVHEEADHGSMSSSVDEWLFDSSRTIGDTAVLRDSSASHVVYFSGLGSVAWKYYAGLDIIDNEENKKLELLESGDELSSNESAIFAVDIIGY